MELSGPEQMDQEKQLKIQDWKLWLLVVWILFVHALYYWTLVREYAPGLLDRFGIGWFP
ncbi:hypothetical protein MYX82_00150 [Acidobacteria bacterium AH-259-D05]|nr:hypothetical protein [Acidobacteria bacterium AH-259-D05]